MVMGSIFILTNFINWDEAYSLCRVVRDQVTVLMDAGHGVKLGVCGAFDPHSWPSRPCPEFVQFRFMPLHDEWKDMPAVFERSNELVTAMELAMREDDLIITHDILFQPDAMLWNVATRKLIEYDPGKRWLHWFHSPTPIWSLIDDRTVLDYCLSWPARSWLVFPNHADLRRVGNRYRCPTNRRKVVHHAFDFAEHYFHGDVVGKAINSIVRFEHYDCILLLVARLDRGKQVEYAVEITGALERLAVSSVLFVVDFHSRGDEKGNYRERLKELALQRACHTFFSSEILRGASSIDHKTLLNLVRVAHVLVNASRSESYSLITQEAFLCRTLVILNANYPAMRELWGTNAIYAEFGSDINAETMGDGRTIVEYDDVFRFAETIAKQIKEYLRLPTMAGEAAIRASRTLTAVYEKQLGPLIMEARAT